MENFCNTSLHMVETDALNRARSSLFLASFELCETKRYSSAECRISLNMVLFFSFFLSFFFARARECHTTPMETAQNIIHNASHPL